MDWVLIGWPGGDWQTTLKIVGAVFGSYYAAIWLAALVWTYRDIRERTRDPLSQILAVLLVLVFSLPGLVLYLILRPRHTLAEAYERTLEEEALLQELEDQSACPRCKRRIQPEYVACPFCANKLKEPCSSCGKAMSHSWHTCPYCGTPKRQAVKGMEKQPGGVPAIVPGGRVSAKGKNGATAPAPTPAPQPAAVPPPQVTVAAASTPEPAAAPEPRRAAAPAPSTAHTLLLEDDAESR